MTPSAVGKLVAAWRKSGDIAAQCATEAKTDSERLHNLACAHIYRERADELEALATAPPEQAELRKVLESGLLLVESAFAHVSHGGPTRADAEKWIQEARNALGIQLV